MNREKSACFLKTLAGARWTIALTFALLATKAYAQDLWFGRDKALHFSASAVIAGAGYGGTAVLTESPPLRLTGGATLALGAGLAKELYDLSGRGDPSWRDLTWDVVGTATGLAVAWLVDRYVFNSSRASEVDPVSLSPPRYERRESTGRVGHRKAHRRSEDGREGKARSPAS